MTPARQVYYKVYAKAELPQVMVFFTIKDKDDVIQLGDSVMLNFRDGHEACIKKMLKIEKRKGFMFWNNSPEGEEFLKTNSKEISGLLANMIINNK